MATEAQIKANRQNARKSTGPKSDQGKAAVSQNAVKHGLFAESVVTGETEAEYEAFHDKMLAELAPVGTMETMLAERIVSLWWRLRRAERMQNEAIEDMIGSEIKSESARHEREYYYVRQGIYKGDPRRDLEDLPLGRIAKNDWKYSRVLDRMLMYERRIENSVIKLTKELKRFQTIRRIELEDAEKRQTTHSNAVPKRGTDLKPMKNMATNQKDAFTKHGQDAHATMRQTATGCGPAEQNGDLKKQTQFAVVQLSAKSYLKREYDNNPAAGVGENKANLSQFYAPDRIIGQEKAEKLPKIAAG